MEDIRKQVPSTPENWLYKDQSENERQFSTLIYLGREDMPWPECTNEEKEEWEKEHHPEPEQEQEGGEV